MFDETGEFLAILGQFFIVGLFLGVLYDIISFFRIIFGAGKISLFISDFIFVIISALTVVFFSLELTAGEIRIYYFVSAGSGVTAYVFTIGFVTRFFAKLIRKIIKRVHCIFQNKCSTFLSSKRRKLSSVFVNIYRKISKNKEKAHLHLKNKRPIMYNSRIGKLCTNGGEERNVIKAKVRKKA